MTRVKRNPTYHYSITFNLFIFLLIKGNRWEYVNGLLLNVIYGGRVDNNFDLRILRSYLVQYFSDDTLGKQQSAIDNEIAVPLSKNLRVIIEMPSYSIML